MKIGDKVRGSSDKFRHPVNYTGILVDITNDRAYIQDALLPKGYLVSVPLTACFPIDQSRTLWFNEYEGGRLGNHYTSEEECIEAGKAMKPTKRVKFKEIV